jgi:hypothetical protein
MALQLGKPKMPASKPRKDEERETRQATIEADKTEGKDRDLVHGDGGTLGLGRPEDLSHDALAYFASRERSKDANRAAGSLDAAGHPKLALRRRACRWYARVRQAGEPLLDPIVLSKPKRQGCR